MANKITLGGERLGSGNKLKVQLPNFQRSSHDQGYVFTTDQAFGTLVPALCQIGTRGDTFYLDDIRSLVRTLPTNGPVFGSVKHQIDVFAAPVRLYVGALHNNLTGIGLKMEQVKLPVEQHITTVYQDDMKRKNPSTASVNPTSFSHYVGQKSSKAGNGWGNLPYNQLALFKLMYWDVYKNYYANKQEEEGVVVDNVDEGNPAALEVTAVQDRSGTVSWFDVQTQEVTTTAQTSKGNQLSIQFKGTGANSYYLYGNDSGDAQWNKISKNTEAAKNKGWVLTEAANGNAVLTYNPTSTTAIWTFPEGPNFVAKDSVMPTTGIKLTRFPLSNIDDMRMRILSAPLGTPLIVNSDTSEKGIPYNVETRQIQDVNGRIRETRCLPMQGLGIKTHLSDIFNNWLQTDWIDGTNGINELTSIDTSDGSFTVNEFIFEYKYFRMMNRIAISDGSYDGWQKAAYGEDGRVITESPIYCGGYSCEIAFDEVVSNSATELEPLGSLAGRGAAQQGTRKGGKSIKINCDEAMLIMVISSFTPRTTYCQNDAWYNDLESMDDLHKPDMDGIAFQNLPGSWYAAWSDTVMKEGNVVHQVIGKQPSWIEYTTAVNETHGSFVTGEELEHMVFNRSYQSNDANWIANATSYIDPAEFNVVFADQKLTALPFWCQIGLDLTSRRKMSANQIPLL